MTSVIVFNEVLQNNTKYVYIDIVFVKCNICLQVFGSHSSDAREKKRKKIHTQCYSQQKQLKYIWHTYILRSHIGLSLPRAADGAAGVGPHARRGKLRHATGRTLRHRQRASVGKILAKCCSFSAVSAPIFARKYAFCSIFQSLPDYLAEIFENTSNNMNFVTKMQYLQRLQNFC